MGDRKCHWPNSKEAPRINIGRIVAQIPATFGHYQRFFFLEGTRRVFVETGRPLKKGPAYLGSIAQKIDLLQARSVAPLDFGNGSVQMMCKDGGVCGVPSGVWAATQLALGRPAATTAEVGHCGTTGGTFNAKDNTYLCGNNTQSPWVWVFANPVKGGGDRYHRSTAYGINYGLQSYLDSFMVSRLYNLISAHDRKAHGLTLLDSGLEINPYNILLSDAVSDCEPLEQLHMLQKMEARLAAITKPGCLPHTLNLKPNLFASLATKPVPTDPAAVRELYTYMQQEKAISALALARYQAAAEGLPATLAQVETALAAHRSSVRNSANCKVMADAFVAAAAQIADKKAQQAWAQKCLQQWHGQETYFGGGYRFVTDPAAIGAAKLAGEPLPAQAVLIQPRLDEVAASLQADVAGKHDARACLKLVQQVRAVAPQVAAPNQRSQWIKQLVSIMGDGPAYKDLHPAIAKAGWKVVATPRPNRLAAAG